MSCRSFSSEILCIHCVLSAISKQFRDRTNTELPLNHKQKITIKFNPNQTLVASTFLFITNIESKIALLHNFCLDLTLNPPTIHFRYLLTIKDIYKLFEFKRVGN